MLGRTDRRGRLVVVLAALLVLSTVAAARLGVSFVGFDLDAAYLKVAAQRVRHELRRPTAKPARAAPRRG
jgi:hypothetical protein